MKARGLLLRIYGIGVLQLVLVIAGAFILPRLVLGPSGPHRREARIQHEHQERRLPPDPENPEAGEEPHRPPAHWRMTLPAVLLGWGLVIVGIGGYFVARAVLKPLRELTNAQKALGEGALQTRIALDRDDEFGTLATSFNQMAAQIQELLGAEKELLANVSHELRTPLARIQVALELAEEGNADAARSALREVAIDCSELETILQDVLTLKRLDYSNEQMRAGGLAIERKDGSLVDVLAQSADRFRARFPSRPFSFRTNDVVMEMPLDAVLLRRAIDNLLENAEKYSPDPTTPVSLELRWIDPGKKSLVIEIEDKGAGIPEEDMPRLFEPFFRGEKSRTRTAGGVGLGLTLVKRIVEAHQGTVTLQSSVGAGTKASVHLPLSPSLSPAKGS